MDLSQREIEIRPRHPWEALDLGCLMARRWFVPLLLCWLVTAVPVFILSVLLLWRRPELVPLAIWFSKPLHERLPLFFLSRVIFGNALGWRELLRQWRPLLLPQMLATLSYRRLSPTRAFDAPVVVLEGLSGSRRSQRLRVLHAMGGSQASWLTILGVHVEGFLQISLFALLYLLIPQNVELENWWVLVGVDAPQSVALFLNLAFFLLVGMVATFYVSAGFALYLNRRTQLEAWDIELIFRRIAQRAQAQPAAGKPIRAGVQPLLAVVGIALLLQLLLPVSALASATQEEALRQARTHIEEIKADPDFGSTEVQRVPKLTWRFARDKDEQPADNIPRRNLDLDWLETLIKALALLAEVLLWAAVAALLLWLFWRGRHLRGSDLLQRRRKSRPASVMGFALHAAALPKDFQAQAQQLWQQQQYRQAFALLLQAALLQLVDKYECPLLEADTERDCLAKAKVLPAPELQYFQQLVRGWQLLAYAHRRPADAEFARLCGDWPETWLA